MSRTKSIVTINCSIPTISASVSYLSGASLRDYDIAIFNPILPSLERVEFSGGGSCLAIESTTKVVAAMNHWASEVQGALRSGKTIFVLVGERKEDSGATGFSVGTRNSRTYSTGSFNNYQALPFGFSVRNTKGRVMKVADSRFRGLFEAIKDVASYQGILEQSYGQPAITANDGAVLSSVLQMQGMAGRLVLLPYFDLHNAGLSAQQKTQVSHSVVSQLVGLDRVLTTQNETTPPPDWLAQAPMPRQVSAIDDVVAGIDSEIVLLMERKDRELDKKASAMAYSRLLYENGKPLEEAIEDALKLLGYTVENYRSGDVEIDHVFVGPAGLRMIGESEGKDNSPIDISKFRQLESNINEDFQREEVTEPAKGVLFGNAYRAVEPSLRAEQFTAKCFTNSVRLGTALIKTTDLYLVAVYALDNPDDQAFLESCRTAIETTSGGVVVFPLPP